MSESEHRKTDDETSSKGLITSLASVNETGSESQEDLLLSETRKGESFPEFKSDGTAGQQYSVLEDDSSNSGFIVIKPNASACEKEEEKEVEEEESGGSNLILFQNSVEVSLQGLDADVLNQVQRALEESGMDHSVLIVNDDDGAPHTEKGSSYIIDLNIEDKSHKSNQVSISNESVVAAPIPSTSLSTKLVRSPDDQITIPNLNCSEVQIYTSAPSNFSLATKSNSKAASLCSDMHASSTAPSCLDSSIVDSANGKQEIKTPSSFSPLKLNAELKGSHTPIPKNLSQPTSSQEQSSPHSPFMDGKQHTSNSATSHVAEQFLNIAKKMIGDGGSMSQRISVDETMGKIVISPEQKSSKEKSTDSVITMYLSSPNELKSKLQKFKTDSPVIIVQAGEEPLTEEEEDDDGNVGKTKEVINPSIKDVTKIDSSNIDKEMALEKSSESSSSQSDSLAAALSSFAADSTLYSCSECGYSSHNKHYYKQHVDLVHNEDRPYKCPHCDYAGKRRHALLEHMVVHSDQRPFACSYCNASFRKKGHLTNHVKLHTSQRLVQCGVCNIQLPDAEAFESHLRKIHNTDKLFKCKLCDHTVVDRQAMLNHLTSHYESFVFSCPNCSSNFHEEKMLMEHMREVHGIIKVNEDAKSSVETASKKMAPVSSGDVKNVQQANIICSECGFICTDTQVMKKHMWVHIDSSSDMNVQIKGQGAPGGSSPSNNSAMGVLKMNVVSGLKTLPENVMYQCTSCNFTSSDNSVFIKHMLLHKTQRRSHLPVSNAVEPSAESEAVSKEKSQGKSITVLSNVSQPSASSSLKGSPANNVPFIFDQSSGRFRCLICGYHCDYQRTIKAHIWKHSGHQNIEYPVFDQAKKKEATNTFIPVTRSEESQQNRVPASTTSVSSGSASSASLPMNQMQLLKTSSGDIVKLLPVDPKMTKYKPGDLIQIKDNAIIVSEKCEKDSPADRFLKTMTVPVQSKTENVTFQPSTNTVEEIGEDVKVKVETSLSHVSTLSLHKDSVNEMLKHENSVTSRPAEKESVEPSVVVEIVETVPSGLGLTGLKSQQGSPRVSDLESSGGEAKLSFALKDVFSSEKSCVEDASVTHQSDVEPGRRKYNLRKPKGTKRPESPSSPDENGDSPDRSDIGSTYTETTKVNLKQEKSHAKAEAVEEMDTLNNAESDSTESSDEVNSAGESGSSSNPPKTGICSSLLAVIEQLRERSRSEGEKSVSPIKELPKRISKRNKKYSNTTDTAPLSEFHNIEKINSGEGEKYRCSLCHYTSQRICNMKIHMKTHRQKKPSECSLCDFSSTIPEALQEHMLQHCKVRTYACKFCPQNFNHKSTLRAHMRAHKDKEPYLCAYCVFEATTATELKEHMQVHSGCSSRLRCPGCDHIMNNKEELTSHLMKCTGKSDNIGTLAAGDTKLADASQIQESSAKSVQEADSAASVTSTPNTFMTTATEHACVVSGCSFTSYSLKELQEHLSVHCNPSLLVCDLCDFKALHSRSLKSHMKRHANDQRYVQQPLEQYKCNLCGYVCHHLPSLKSHMWRHASDQSYSYEFTNDVINAAIDHDSRVDANAGEADDPELLDRVINSERRIMEGELTKSGQGDGQRPTCWVTFRCCSCGFETINKAKLNIHMRSHSDIIKQTLDGVPRKPGQDKSNYASAVALAFKSPNKRSADAVENDEPLTLSKARKVF